MCKWVIIVLAIFVSSQVNASEKENSVNKVCQLYGWSEVEDLVQPYMDVVLHTALIMQGQSSEYRASEAASQAIYDDMPENDVKIKLRIANPYKKGIGIFEVTTPVNDNYPAFKFSTDSIAASTGVTAVAKSALDGINIVPNPYYGFSNYERSPVDNIAKLTNLPEKCLIRIYNTSGTLIRTFDKDNTQTYLDWDLKNSYGISISSGVFIIHLDAYELGEKVIKWFGSTRPVDLTSF